MFKKFEGFTKPFPDEEPSQPPSGIFAFCRYYTRGFEVPLILMSLMATVVAIVEVSLFGAMGNLVDWLSTSNPETFWQENQSELMLYGGLLLVVLSLIHI